MNRLASKAISIVLVSSILNFQTALFTKGNGLPYSLYLPTCAAAAWFHKKQAELARLKKDVSAFLSAALAR
jgi:hypothetical protein